MTTPPFRSNFVWHELMTSDAKAAIQFYTHVVGWTTQSFGGEEGDSDYQMWVGSQGPLGGVTHLPEAARKMGAPPHWMANVSVADLDTTVARVREFGGNVLSGPHDMPGVGRFAVIADPQGATISAFQPETLMSPKDASQPGAFGWGELYATDQHAAFQFYHQIFGWAKEGTFDMGPMGEYVLFGNDGKQLGGMMAKPKDMPMPPAWMYYIYVADLDAALERATSSGAKLLNGPMPVPGGARIAQFIDPQGATFALLGT